MDIREESLQKHYEWKGKIEVTSVAHVNNSHDLSLAYTPGVAQPCLEIQADPSLAYSLTRKWNSVAVITDGSAVLGLGNIGGLAGMPVMEGKCLLFKEFAGIDAIPICINTNDTEQIINTIRYISDSFGGINLEDISAPRCFEIEKRLREECNIPVFHDDQHGTAITVAAALLNALKYTKKSIDKIKLVISGAGAAGTAIGRHIAKLGCKNIIYVDKNGALVKGAEYTNPEHARLAEESNPDRESGLLGDVMKGADVFIGVSAPGIVSEDMVRSMDSTSIVFSLANPTPEIMPDVAKAAGATVVGTGRSDFHNQINNVLAFPGIFRGLLDSRARTINDDMEIAATYAIAGLINEDELRDDYIIPSPFDKRVVEKIAEAVKDAAIRTGVAGI